MTDAVDGLFSHVIMSSLLVMALFMAEDMITLCCATQRLKEEESKEEGEAEYKEEESEEEGEQQKAKNLEIYI